MEALPVREALDGLNNRVAGLGLIRALPRDLTGRTSFQETDVIAQEIVDDLEAALDRPPAGDLLHSLLPRASRHEARYLGCYWTLPAASFIIPRGDRPS